MEIGFFKKASDRIESSFPKPDQWESPHRIELDAVTSKLCEHLQQIGVNATLLLQNSPEALKISYLNPFLAFPVPSTKRVGDLWGYAKIDRSNIDLAVVQYRVLGPSSGMSSGE